MKFKIVLLMITVLVSQCSAEQTSDRSSLGNSEALKPTSDSEKPNQQLTEMPPAINDHGASDGVIPPEEYYLESLKMALGGFQHQDATDGNLYTTPVLWLNFFGAELSKGYTRGKSFILCEDTAELPEAAFSDEEKTQIVTNVQNYFDRVSANLLVVTEKPEEGYYTSLHVGGSLEDLGCEDDKTILGIAPLDWRNINSNDVAFVFSETLKEYEEVYERVYGASLVIAHEAAHTFGLRHIENEKAVMGSSIHNDVEGFLSGKVKGSSVIQNSPELLRAALNQNQDNAVEEIDDLTVRVCQQILQVQSLILEIFGERFTGEEFFLKTPLICKI